MDITSPEQSLDSPVGSSDTSLLSYTTAESTSEDDSTSGPDVNDETAHDHDHDQAQEQAQDNNLDSPSDEYLIRAPRLAAAVLPHKQEQPQEQSTYVPFMFHDPAAMPMIPPIVVRASSAPVESLHDAPGSSTSSSAPSLIDMSTDMYMTPETTGGISCYQIHGGVCPISVDCPNCHFADSYIGSSRNDASLYDGWMPMAQRNSSTIDYTHRVDVDVDGYDGQDVDDDDEYASDHVTTPTSHDYVFVEGNEYDLGEHHEHADEVYNVNIHDFLDNNEDSVSDSVSVDSLYFTNREDGGSDHGNDYVSVNDGASEASSSDGSVSATNGDSEDNVSVDGSVSASEASSSDGTATTNDSEEEEDSEVSSASSSEAESDDESISTAPTSEASSTITGKSSDEHTMVAQSSTDLTTHTKSSDHVLPAQDEPVLAVAVQADSTVLDTKIEIENDNNKNNKTQAEAETGTHTQIEVAPAASKKRRAEADAQESEAQPVAQRRRLTVGDYLPAFAVGTAFGAVGTVFGLMQLAPQ